MLSPDDSVNAIARATDTAMLLEYLFNEGATTEIGFRLGMSVAWLLESTTADRQLVLSTLRTTYDLRSKQVHGVRQNNKTQGEEVVSTVLRADRLLRRAILAKLIGGYSDEAWRQAFTMARLGALPNGFDQVPWAP